MALRRQFVLSFLAALTIFHASAEKISLSVDGGLSWRPLESPVTDTSLPDHVHLKAGSEASAPTLHVPRCAVQDDLQISLVRERPRGAILGMRWVAAKACRGEWKDDQKSGVVVTEEVIPRLRPDWASYVRDRVVDGAVEADGEGSESGKKEQGFFAKYGLYIMGFVGLALARGIQVGMAELREEMEREEADKLRERKSSGQVKVVVPKKKQCAKNRRKNASSSTRKQ